MAGSNKIKLSIVISVYSETFSLVETVDRLIAKNRDYIYELILVVSPMSSKKCIDICNLLMKNNNLIKIHIQKNNPGLGFALREGMTLAEGTHIAIMSSDLETEPEAIDRMVKKIEETNCDLVVGNRWLNGGGFQDYDHIKLILNYLFQSIFKLIYNTSIGDITYGFKIISKNLESKINWESSLHEICIETTIKPLINNAKIEQIPTIWIGRKEGYSKNSFMKNFRYLSLALKVRIGLAK